MVTTFVNRNGWIGKILIYVNTDYYKLHFSMFVYLGRERQCESRASCLRTQQNVPGQGSNPGRSIPRRARPAISLGVALNWTFYYAFNKTCTKWLPRSLHGQGFRQFCRVADIFVKAPDVTSFWRRKAPFEHLSVSYLGGLGACSPRKFLTLRNVVSSISGN